MIQRETFTTQSGLIVAEEMVPYVVCVCVFPLPFPLISLNYGLQVAAYDTVAKKMAFFDPSRAKDFLFISGTKVSVGFSRFLRCFRLHHFISQKSCAE